MNDDDITKRLSKHGGPAFPHPTGFRGYTVEGNSGMSIRQWLAGQTLAGLCANQKVLDVAAAMVQRDKLDNAGTVAIFAKMAVEIADGTLAELAKEKA